MPAPSTPRITLDYGALAVEQAYQEYLEDWRHGPQSGADAALAIHEAFRAHPELESVSIETDWDRSGEPCGRLAAPRFRRPRAEIAPDVLASIQSQLANASWALSQTSESGCFGAVHPQLNAADTARALGLLRAAAHLEAKELNDIAPQPNPVGPAIARRL